MKKNKGFSLTEIVVTIVIIVVLSTISGPIYNSYSTKSKMAEGYLLLGTIKDAQMKWYADAGYFVNKKYNIDPKSDGSCMPTTCYETILGIDARANKYYTSFCVNAFVHYEAAYSKFKAIVYGSSGAKNITMICPSDGPTTLL